MIGDNPFFQQTFMNYCRWAHHKKKYESFCWKAYTYRSVLFSVTEVYGVKALFILFFPTRRAFGGPVVIIVST